MSIFPSLLHVFRIVHLIPPPCFRPAPTAPLPSLFSLPLPPLAFPPAFSPSPLSNLSQFSNLSPPLTPPAETPSSGGFSPAWTTSRATPAGTPAPCAPDRAGPSRRSANPGAPPRNPSFPLPLPRPSFPSFVSFFPFFPSPPCRPLRLSSRPPEILSPSVDSVDFCRHTRPAGTRPWRVRLRTFHGNVPGMGYSSRCGRRTPESLRVATKRHFSAWQEAEGKLKVACPFSGTGAACLQIGTEYLAFFDL